MPAPPRWLQRPALTRRQVLGAAAGAGIGTGLGASLGHWLGPGLIEAAASRPAWSSPLDRERHRLAQLLRRAGFAITPAALDAAQHDGFTRTLDRLLETPPAEPSNPIPPEDRTRGSMLAEDLQVWWLRHLMTTPTPFAERMTYFWHGHFTSDLDKSGGLFMYWQNLTWRRMALGQLGSMLRQVTIDPAMLTYLDLAESDASDPAQPPNENYARELMELFTLGPGHYTEADVKAAAKALAGWTLPPADRQVETVVDEATGMTEPVDVWDQPATGVFVADAAFNGGVKFLGRHGRLGLAEVIDAILAQPAAANFIARRVAIHFISPNPAAETVQSLADVFRRSGYQVRPLMRAAFTSREFRAASSYRALVRSPIDVMVAAVLAVGAPPGDAAQLVTDSSSATGQALLQPPNVAGWPPNAAWISPGALLARFNFMAALLDSLGDVPSPAGARELHLESNLSSATAQRLAHAAGDGERWLVLLSSPEFNLK